jgi:leucyl-tRNA synthetase
MRDLGLVSFDEPMLRLFNQGIILGDDNEKMSKSRGNFVDPDPLIERYGADTLRCFLMFIGPWDQGGPWNSRGIDGVARFLNRAWAVATDTGTAGSRPDAAGESALRRMTHRTIKRVGDDLERFSFNTAISAMMELVNEMMRMREAGSSGDPTWHEASCALALLLAPFAPYQAEELWARLGGPFSVHLQPWPTFDPALLEESEVEIVVQVNGKIRDRVLVAAGANEETVKAQALQSERVRASFDGKTVQKVVVVPGKLVNIVVR